RSSTAGSSTRCVPGSGQKGNDSITTGSGVDRGVTYLVVTRACMRACTAGSLAMQGSGRWTSTGYVGLSLIPNRGESLMNPTTTTTWSRTRRLVAAAGATVLAL